MIIRYWNGGLKYVKESSNGQSAGSDWTVLSGNHCKRILFASGQIPIDPATGEIKGEDITEQAELVMKNIGEILKEAGTVYENVVKTTCFLANMEDFGAFNAVYEKYFTGKPARSCVAVKQLPKNVLCEVEVISAI